METEYEYGIVLDNHFTDSLICAISEKRPTSYRKLTSNCDPLPPHEVLTSLLLHGKAYLSKPIWIDDLPLSELNPLIDEGIVDWIPRAYYENSYHQLATMNRLSKKVIPEFHEEEVPANLATDGIYYGKPNFYRKSEYLENKIYNDEAEFTRNFYLKKSLFLRPSIISNLNHFQLPVSIIDKKSFNPIAFAGTASDVFDRFESYADLETGSTFQLIYDAQKMYEADRISYRNESVNGAKMLDAYLSSLAMDKFIATAKLPSNVSSSKGMNYDDCLASRCHDEIALVKIQFNHVRYPVIQNIGDVIRLRNSPHIECYREVIKEYSSRLQDVDEPGRQVVFEKFKHDIELASKTITNAHRLETIYENFGFYFSLPAEAISQFAKFAIPGIIPIGIACIMKVVPHVFKRKHRWIMFGKN